MLIKKAATSPVNMAICLLAQATNLELFLIPLSILPHHLIYQQVLVIQLPKYIPKSSASNTLVHVIIMYCLDYCSSFSMLSLLVPLSPFSQITPFLPKNSPINSNYP